MGDECSCLTNKVFRRPETKNDTKSDKQIHQHSSLAMLLAIKRHSCANCSFNKRKSKRNPFKWMFPSLPQPPWSLFKSTSLTSCSIIFPTHPLILLRFLPHSPCTFPRPFPRYWHFTSPHPPLAISFSPFLAWSSWTCSHSQETDWGLLANVQKNCKGEKCCKNTILITDVSCMAVSPRPPANREQRLGLWPSCLQLNHCWRPACNPLGSFIP